MSVLETPIILKLAPELAAEILRGCQIVRGDLEARLHVVADVWSEPVALVQAWEHLRNEPQPA